MTPYDVKVKIISNQTAKVRLLKISESPPQTELAAMEHLLEGKFLRKWTNVQLRIISNDASGNSKTNTVHSLRTRFRTQKNK
jgi:hypothetical protein